MIDDVIKIFLEFYSLILWNEGTPCILLKIVDECCQNGIKYDHLTIQNSTYKPLYFSPGSKRLEPDSTHSDLIGTMSAFNCLYLGHYFSDRAEICH